MDLGQGLAFDFEQVMNQGYRNKDENHRALV